MRMAEVTNLGTLQRYLLISAALIAVLILIFLLTVTLLLMLLLKYIYCNIALYCQDRLSGSLC